MRDDEKAAAIAANDYQLWPGWSEGNPVLENTEESIKYGELVYLHYSEYERLRRTSKNLCQEFWRLNETWDFMPPGQPRLAREIRRIREACEAFMFLAKKSMSE